MVLMNLLLELLGISTLCRGIWDETGKMNPEKKS